MVGSVERTARVDEHYALWVEDVGPADAVPGLLVMGANASATG